MCWMPLKLKDLDTNDINDLYIWRNHPIVRKNSFSSRRLLWDEHKKWFQKKRRSSNTTIYIAYSDKGDKVGSIRFEIGKHAVGVNVMVNPDFIGKGFGSKLIKIGVKRFIDQRKSDKLVIAEIKEGNIASIKAFEKAGFKISHHTYVYGK